MAALRVLVNSTTLAGTARKLSVSEETIEGILNRHIDTRVNWEQYAYLGLIGVALKKGRRDYVAIITMPLEGGGISILGVLADPKKQTVKAFLRGIPALGCGARSLRDMHGGHARGGGAMGEGDRGSLPRGAGLARLRPGGST